MKVSTEMIKELRQVTGAGVLEAKKTLEAHDGDYDKALAELREKGASQAEKRSHRQAKEGVVEVYSHPGGRVGVMLELNCETDFVARNENFTSLAHDLVLHVAAMEPQYVDVGDIPEEMIKEKKRELEAEAATSGKPQEIVDKIVAGRLSKYYEEVCLLEQPFVKDDEVKVRDLVTNMVALVGENIVVSRFVRYELGQ